MAGSSYKFNLALQNENKVLIIELQNSEKGMFKCTLKLIALTRILTYFLLAKGISETVSVIPDEDDPILTIRA